VVANYGGGYVFANAKSIYDVVNFRRPGDNSLTVTVKLRAYDTFGIAFLVLERNIWTRSSLRLNEKVDKARFCQVGPSGFL
jgi:hypothetical protein